MKNFPAAFRLVGRTLTFIAPSTLAIALALTAPAASPPPLDPASLPLLKRAFAEGREYFVLRSGRAKLIAQTDQFDLAPAFLHLLFDAQDNYQSGRKERAFNFAGGQGFANSALEVELGGFAFTAVGHQTHTRWVTVEGIPAVEAVWWAGGLRVTERLLALGDEGLFLRRVELSSVNLGGREEVKLRLRLPPGACVARDGWLVQEGGRCRLALGAAGTWPEQAVPQRGSLEVGPLPIAPGESVSVDTLLLAQIPPRAAADKSWSPLKIRQPATPPPTAPLRPAIWVEPLGAPKTAMNWARPSKPCDAAYRNILAAYGDALRYRVGGIGTNKLTLALGFCEGFHPTAGQRVLAIAVEGKPRRTFDPVAEAGTNAPVVIVLEAVDENADGFVDLAISAAENAKDKNTILNALWVFTGDAPPPEEILAGTHNARAAAFIHAKQPETAPPGQPLPALDLGDLLPRTRTAWTVESSVATDDATGSGLPQELE